MAAVVQDYHEFVSATHPSGEIGWVNIPVTDLDRAIAFYTKVFDWEMRSNFDPFPGHSDGINTHHLFHKGSLSGTFTVLSDPDHVLAAAVVPGTRTTPIAFYLLSDDFDVTLAKVVRHGGTVHHSVALFDGVWGSLAEIIDTEGNFLGVWAPPKCAEHDSGNK